MKVAKNDGALEVLKCFFEICVHQSWFCWISCIKFHLEIHCYAIFGRNNNKNRGSTVACLSSFK